MHLKIRRDWLILLAFWLASLCLDLLWLRGLQAPPMWDQGDHLSRAIAFWQQLQSFAPLDGGWWRQFWELAPSYRGPLSYLLTAPTFALFGPGYVQAIAGNAPWNALLLVGLYGSGRLFWNARVGLWAAALSQVAPLLVVNRTDYLIDFPLAATATLAWWGLSAWFLGQGGSRAAVLAGLGLGAVFLCRPTGLLFFWLPLLWVAIVLVRDLCRADWWRPFQGMLLVIAALALSWPWFSTNWLTILTSVANAREWGLKYQPGLEANSLEGWLYYPLALPGMVGVWVLALVVAATLLPWLRRRSFPRWQVLERCWLWFASYLGGGLLICVLGSTKVERFFLPLLPQVLLLLGSLIDRWRGRYGQGLRTVLALVAVAGLLLAQFPLLALPGIATHPADGTRGWPTAEIVARVSQLAPGRTETVAVLPDHPYLNAFNLDAEGRRQGRTVAAREPISPPDRPQEVLADFDWFVVKEGDQGPLYARPRQAALEERLRSDQSFRIAGQWPLPDGSSVILYQRRMPSLLMQPTECAGSSPSAAVWRAGPTQGVLTLMARRNWLNEHLLLLDWLSPDGQLLAQQELAPARGYGLPGAGCGELLQTIRRPQMLTDDAALQVTALNRRTGVLEALPVGVSAVVPEQLGPPGRDPIAILQSLGQLLRRGEFDPLFVEVGRLNQADPDQDYLRQAVTFWQARLVTQPDRLDLLYPLALAYALQRQAPEAEAILNRIVRLDGGNPNAWLALGVVRTYRFQLGAARMAFDRAAVLGDRSPTLKTLRGVTAALNFDFPAALKLLGS